jgi:hypothetical protein
VVFVEKKYFNNGMYISPGTPTFAVLLSLWLRPLKISVCPRFTTASLVTETFWKASGRSELVCNKLRTLVRPASIFICTRGTPFSPGVSSSVGVTFRDVPNG